MAGLGKLLIFGGLALAALGLLIITISKLVPGRDGMLPGDIIIRRGNFTLYFPIATSILLSIVLTLIIYLLAFRR